MNASTTHPTTARGTFAAASASTSSTSANTTHLLRRGFAFAGIAAAVNLVIFGVASAMGTSMRVMLGPSETVVGVLHVAASSLIPMSLALILTWLVANRRPKSRTVLAWIGLAFALLTVFAPLTSALDVATGAALAIMHVLVGIAWFLAVRPTHR